MYLSTYLSIRLTVVNLTLLDAKVFLPFNIFLALSGTWISFLESLCSFSKLAFKLCWCESRTAFSLRLTWPHSWGSPLLRTLWATVRSFFHAGWWEHELLSGLGELQGSFHLLHPSRSSRFLACTHRENLAEASEGTLCRPLQLSLFSSLLSSTFSSTSSNLGLPHLQTLPSHPRKTGGFAWVFSLCAEAWKLFLDSELKYWAHCLCFLSLKVTLLYCLLSCPASHNRCLKYFDMLFSCLNQENKSSPSWLETMALKNTHTFIEV